MKTIRWGLLFVIIYMAAIIYICSYKLYHYLYVVTSPWCHVLVLIADNYHVHTSNFIYINIIISAIINAVILYLIGIMLDRRND
jgi:hypothetical protein